MERRRLGRSEIEVSPISLGCWAFGGDATWGDQDEADSIGTVHAALDAGINFFDTAEGYGSGRSEEVLGKALQGRRQEAVIATKVSASNLRADDLKAACERSLRRLGTDYIDVYYIHWPSRTIPIEETMKAMEELQAEGKIRVAACSNFGRQDLTELLSVGRVEANQLAYNLLFRAIEYEIQDVCNQQDVGIVCYSPLAQGLLTGKFRSADDVPPGRARTRHFAAARESVRHGEPGIEKEVFEALAAIEAACARFDVSMAEASLAWLLAQKGVASVIAGARRPEQVLRNAQAASVTLPAELVAELTALTEDVKERLGPNADMWQADSRIR